MARTGSVTLPWVEPLSVAHAFSRQADKNMRWIFLHSGTVDEHNRYSLLAWECEKEIRSENFNEFAAALSDNKPAFENAWFGYLGYGLKNTLEKLPQDAPGQFHLPALCMMRFVHILRFDHHTKTLALFSRNPAPPSFLTSSPSIRESRERKCNALSSNMTKVEYLAIVHRTIEQIEAGEFYQANITRKFTGEFSEEHDAFDLFATLCRISPAPYSAFLQLGGMTILSSSPEWFLKIDAQGDVETRPIKGSAPRAADAAEDEKLRDILARSDKDKAENLMIVDLMRNDLSHHCEPGSVRVENLFQVVTYATVHHMVSTIKGQKSLNSNTLDVVKSCFPPGSMTGAPKIRAMQWCSEQEKIERGIYSGAIGWFGGDGSCDLSVVIRTLLLKDKQFEFQVGGGIVADSAPEEEWRETLTKARGIATALGIEMKELEKL